MPSSQLQLPTQKHTTMHNYFFPIIFKKYSLPLHSFLLPAEFYRRRCFNYSEGHLEFLIYSSKFNFNTFSYLEKHFKNLQFILSLGISNSLLLIDFEMLLLQTRSVMHISFAEQEKQLWHLLQKDL